MGEGVGCTDQLNACVKDQGCVGVHSCLATCSCSDAMCTLGCIRHAEGSPVLLKFMTCVNADLVAKAEQSQAFTIIAVTVGAFAGAAVAAVSLCVAWSFDRAASPRRVSTGDCELCACPCVCVCAIA